MFEKLNFQSTIHEVTISTESIFIDNKSEFVVLLLHGYAQNASIFFRKIFSDLQLEFSILALNAPFPVTTKVGDRNNVGYSWYFYDSIDQKMILSPDISVKIISDLIKKNSLETKKIIILGYSQGGYLAPFICNHIEGIVGVIAIGSGYPEDRWKNVGDIFIVGIHGDLDNVVPFLDAKNDFFNNIKTTYNSDFVIMQGRGHNLDSHIKDTAYGVIQKIIKNKSLEDE